MHAAVGAVLFIASLTPAKGWFGVAQPITIHAKAPGETHLLLSDFNGRVLEAKGSTDVNGEATFDLRDVYVQLQIPNTYVLYLVEKEKTPEEMLKEGVPAELVEKVKAAGGSVGNLAPTKFIGTPLVIDVRQDRRRGAPPGPMVVRVQPLEYAVMQTAHGPVTLGFFYDVAPHTVNNFLSLAQDGYYDGLTFHRVVPGYVIQGGDPRGDGTGGPGYMIDAEFSSRPHEEGVLSMARTGDPGEGPGVMPRPEFANSAGSQFFVCLDYRATKQLDGKYSCFSRVTGGMEAVRKIAAAPLADERAGRPKESQVIEKVEVLPVTAESNPYRQIMRARDVTLEKQQK